ncbi:hypothetical protein [Limnoglobus roseus]|uniref:hypothetical protein n=1 Tax=Limnoglobus roseus TaxID=2598579 RepID=UPI001FEAA28F|nr:hypothetical protein [Limnoglobus roseus]
MLQLEASRRIVEVAEAYADGEVRETELRSVADSSEFACIEPQFVRESATQLSARVADAVHAAKHLATSPIDLGFIAQNTSRDKSHDFVLSTQNNFGIGIAVRRDESEFAEKVKLLRDIFGNPFHPVAFDPTWRTSTAVAFANEMYQSRDFSGMPILADALQDAGCENEDILNHCRGEGPHVRGCWVVDLILGKE